MQPVNLFRSSTAATANYLDSLPEGPKAQEERDNDLSGPMANSLDATYHCILSYLDAKLFSAMETQLSSLHYSGTPYLHRDTASHEANAKMTWRTVAAWRMQCLAL